MPGYNLANFYAENIALSGPSFDALTKPQKAAVRGIVAKLHEGRMRIFATMPTQTGKTGVYLYIVDQLYRNGALDRGLVLSPYKSLVDQILNEEVPKFAPTLFLKDQAKRLDLRESKIANNLSVGTYAGGAKMLSREALEKQNIGLVVLDEAHMALSKFRQKVLQGIPETVEIAVTASPNYSHQKGLEQSGYIEAYRLDLKTSAQKGYSSPVRNMIVIPTDFRGTLDQISIEGGDYNIGELDKLLNQEAAIQVVVDFLKGWKDPENDKPLKEGTGIIFCNSVNHARAVADRINETFEYKECGSRIPCAAIWGQMSNREKQNLIQRHKDGEIMSLACADFLIHGYSNPLVDFVLNVTPTRSAVVAEQRPGRALGKNPNNPDKKTLVVDFVYPAKQNHQLLYGDVIGGFLFQSLQTGKSKTSRYVYTPSDLPKFKGFTFYYEEKEIFNFVAERNRQKLLNSLPHMKKISPDIRNAMLERGITSYKALSYKIKEIVVKHDLDAFGGGSLTEIQLSRLVYGRDLPFKKSWKEYTLAATVVAAAMGMRPEKLFGAIPDGKPMRAFSTNALFAPSHAYPIEYDWSPEEEVIVNTKFSGVMHMDDPELEEAMRTGHLVDGNPVYICDLQSVADAADIYDEKELKTTLSRVLASLKPTEERVLRMRFGTHKDNNCKLDEVGHMLGGMSGQNVAYIEAKALAQMKRPSRVKLLECFRDNSDTGGDARHPSAQHREHQKHRASLIKKAEDARALRFERAKTADKPSPKIKLTEEQLAALQRWADYKAARKTDKESLLSPAEKETSVINSLVDRSSNMALSALEETPEKKQGIVEPLEVLLEIPVNFTREKRGVNLEASFKFSPEGKISLSIDKRKKEGKIIDSLSFDLPSDFAAGAKVEMYELVKNKMVAHVTISRDSNFIPDRYALEWLLK